MSTVTLSAMTTEEFQAWRLHSLQAYAQEKVNAGVWSLEEAEQRSREEFDELLPDGLASESQLLFCARDAAGEQVGILWLSLVHPRGAPDTAFVYDIEIEPDRRGQGYGHAVLAAGEDVLRGYGVRALGLNVFGDNPNAIRLYETSGYDVTSQQMRKVL
jgi:ribosomal protein S18 acetylase RimI-like enzyme